MYSILLVVPWQILDIVHYFKRGHLFLEDIYVHLFTCSLIQYLFSVLVYAVSLFGTEFTVINQTEQDHALLVLNK